MVQGQIVHVATDNTTVVAYINKEGGIRSGSLCTLLWRLLHWCNLRQIVLKTRHIPGRLNVIVEQVILSGSGNSDIVVPPIEGVQPPLSILALWTCLPPGTIAN